MKNSAKALAPAGVCVVATSGMTGGFSPGFMFGPVVGTSDGTVGVAGAVRVGVRETVGDGGAVDVTIDEPAGVDGSDETGDGEDFPPPELVQPAAASPTIRISHARRTRR